MKPITQSKTTATVAGATGTTGGVVFALLALLRGQGVSLPWEADADTAIMAVVTTVVAPLISRLVAKWRKGDGVSGAALGFLLCGLAGLMSLGAAGCNTTPVLGPDGEVIGTQTTVDAELVEKLAILALDPELHRQAWTLIREIDSYYRDIDKAESVAEREELTAKIAARERAFDKLVEAAKERRATTGATSGDG